ncbi:MAG: ScaI family restriction endonuclease [Gammaproteobacteria bacterium]|nr:MAG: ScaI family restriction endonuclease [Gammaproteobacteria bacterium]RKZ43173.1 MAG: ScaI family restriction endonuclease [Gammaproteobacteria bacterium]RKZ72552.1 MAG: ScaI family restriction endonuclease [Gammaproteobacteria bacterium]
MTVYKSTPYENVSSGQWYKVTESIIMEHPLAEQEIVDIVLSSWDSIFDSSIGKHHFKIGKHIFPKHQIMGFLLHELITLETATRYPSEWRGEKNPDDKYLVYIPDVQFSIEIKTSSNKNKIFGNRSYAQAAASNKKSKSGYYLAVNFEKFENTRKNPIILLIRFGWLEHSDWIGQKSQTGQQARLSIETYGTKFKTLYTER